MHPFLKKAGAHIYIKLHKEFYPPDLIHKIKKEEPDAITSVRNKDKYIFLELNTKEMSDHFDFLNFLIYHKKNQ